MEDVPSWSQVSRRGTLSDLLARACPARIWTRGLVVPSYLLKASHTMKLPADSRPSATEIADWLERTLCSSSVSIYRAGDTSLEFRSKFRFLNRDRRNDSLALVAEGEIEVSEHPEGALVTVRANPYIWETVVPIVGLVWFFGWTLTTEVLQWGAGVGGIIVGGLFVLLTRSSLKSVMSSIGKNLLTALRSPKHDLGISSGRSLI